MSFGTTALCVCGLNEEIQEDKGHHKSETGEKIEEDGSGVAEGLQSADTPAGVWCTPKVLAPGRLREGGCELKASLTW